MLTYIEGDLTTIELGKDEYVVHQCNCKTTVGKGLSKELFDKYPESNIYNDDTARSMGNIIVRAPVINLLGQKYPGRAKFPKDFARDRLVAFRLGLKKITTLDGIKKVYFPFQIGCGLAGGHWETYENELKAFSDSVDFEVIIVRRPQD